MPKKKAEKVLKTSKKSESKKKAKKVKKAKKTKEKKDAEKVLKSDITPVTRRVIKCDDDLERLGKETHDTGVIYRITNDKNDKIYYGQTMSYRNVKGKKVRNGAKKRFREHITDALRGKDGCAKLMAAIRKHGPESFKTETVLICSLENMDLHETYFIKRDDTIKKGYNIISWNITPANEGSRKEKISKTMKAKWKNDEEYISKTTKANLKAVKKRAKEGLTRSDENKDLPHNIYKNPDGGYDIRIMRDGKYKITSVVDKSKSDKKVLKLAIKKRDELLEQFKNGNVEWQEKNVDHNGDELPKCIIRHTARGSQGYKVKMIKDKKRIDRIFVSKKLSMDEKLEKAKEMLETLKNDFTTEINKENPNNKANNGIDHYGNTLPKGIRRCKARTSIGYSAAYRLDGKEIRIRLTDMNKTMDEKLNEAKQWLTDNMQ